MINRDLYKVLKGIEKCRLLSNKADINFTMSLARIESEVSAELNIIEKGRKPVSDSFKEYSKKRREIEMKYAIQKEDGTLQTLGNELIIRNPKEYFAEITTLDIEFRDSIKEYENNQKEFENFLDTPCKTKISKINRKLFPTQVNVEQISLLFSVIE